MRGIERCRQGCGGKAAELCALQEAGFLVPAFEVCPPNLAATTEQLGFPLVVRSSATLEDGERSSFAGVFRSFLRLRNLQETRQAVEACLASVHGAEVANYCHRQGIDPNALRMGYIVQQMIEPELAGVAFTIDPVSGRDELVVNACEGLADELLAGSKNPVPADHPVLLRYLPQIRSIARQVEMHFGRPQDIEFACVDGRVYLLQARPITRIDFVDIEGEWTNANFRDGGVSSGVCSPLMISLYALIWDAALKQTLKETKLWVGDFASLRTFFCRPYWNLQAVKRSVSLLPGYAEREFDDDLGVATQESAGGTATPFTWRTVLRALPVVYSVRRFLHRQRTAVRQLLSDGIAPYAARRRSWIELIERDYFHVEYTYFRTVFAVSLMKQAFKRSFPGCDYGPLVACLPPLSHLAPLRRMRLGPPANTATVLDFLKEFPHPSRWGLDIRHPRWEEEPAFIEELWHNLPTVERRDTVDQFQLARDKCLHLLPRRRHTEFLRKLEALRDWVWLREESRDVSTRMYHLLRQRVLDLADQRGTGQDIFFMTYQEIAVDDRSQIEARKAEFNRYRHFPAPNEIRCVRHHAEPVAGKAWQGIGASAGLVRGVARVAMGIDEASRLPAGCILVCPFTEPSWTPILDRFTAVIAETGGQLSHAAVLCREFGIPAVLGISDATRRIRDGARITVDGGQGWVRSEE